jgi:NADPH:quinone reductase-like Zn-dependent oxidoreductase
MRAAVQTEYGPPEVVRVTDVPEPEVGDRDVLVRVHVTTVNRTDCGFRAARPFVTRFFTGLRRPRRGIMGNEFAGVVEAVGSSVDAYAVGDRLFGYHEGPFGCHAELLAVAEDANVATIPDGITFEQAAAATEGSHYALSYIRAADVGAGDRVLVNGATGGIGSAAVQILHHLGAHVTAVCAGEHAETIRSLGAERVIDFRTEDFTQDAEARADPYDLVFDSVGKSTWARCRPLLAARGCYASSELGPKGQNPVLAVTTKLLRRDQRVLFPLPKIDHEIIGFIRGLLASGELRPLIDRAYPLDEIVAAYRYVESGEKIGNVLITMPNVPAQDEPAQDGPAQTST